MAAGRSLRLWLARHARPLVAPGLCYGASDLPAEAGATADAARVLAAVLPPGLLAWTSPLQRCEQLSQQLQGLRPDLTFNRDARLTEMNFGCWEGVAWADIPRAAFDAWTADFAHHRFGGMESTQMVIDRVAAALAELQRVVGPGGQAVWVTHAGVIRAACYLAGGGPRPIADARAWPVQAPAPGGWTCLALGGAGPAGPPG